MKRNYSFFKKLLSAVLSLMICASLFAIIPAEAALSVLKLDKQSFLSATEKTTIIKSAPSANYYSRSSESSAWEAQMVLTSAAIYNNNSSTFAVGSEGIAQRSFGDYQQGNVIKKIHTDGKLRYLDITYDLGNVCTVTNVAIMGAKTTKHGNESALGAYKLYAYQEEADIVSPSSLVYDYNYASQTADSQDPYLYQTYSMSVLARFVTIRITRATVADAMKNTSDLSTTVPRLFFGVYGERKFNVTLKTGELSRNDDLFAGVGATVVVGNPTVYVSKKNTETNQFERTAITGYAGALANLWNSDIDGGGETMLSPYELKFAEPEETCHNCGTAYEAGVNADKCPNEECKEGRKAKEYYTDGSKHFVDIEYDLMQKKQIKNIVVSNHKTPILQTSYYRIYASNSVDDLYLPENLVYEKRAEATTTRSQVLTLENNVSARYVAMRVFNPCGGNAEELAANPTTALYTNVYIRLLEFNVFGNEPYSIKNSSRDIISHTNYLKTKKSIIEGKSPSKAFAFVNGTEHSLTEAIYEVDDKGNILTDEKGQHISVVSKYPNFTVLTNDEVLHDDEIRSINNNMLFIDDSGNVIDDETKLYAQFNYKLDAQTNISGVEIYGHSNASYSPSHMKFSIADKEEDLFTENATFTSDDIRSASNGIGVELNVPECGSFVGVRIICAVMPNCSLKRDHAYMRIRDISIYGNYKEAGILPSTYRQIYHENGIRKEVMNSDVSFNCSTDSNGNICAGVSAQIKAPVSFRYNGEIYSFYSWTDLNGKTLSEDLIYDYKTTPESAQLFANYKKVTDKTVKFKFLNKAGTVVYETDVIFGHYLSREQYESANASIESIPGYEVEKKEISFGSRTAVMPVWSEDIYNKAAETECSFSPIFVPEAKTYTVTYYEDVRNLKFDTKVTFNNSESKVYWLVDGIVMGNNGTSFTMYVSGDAVITTQSSATVNNIALFDKAYIKNYDGTVFAKIVKTPYKIVEVGVVFADGSKLQASEYDSKLKLGADNVLAVKAEHYSTNNGFSITLKNIGRKRVRVARAYIKYKSSAFGSEKTEYSNVVLIET